MLAIGSFALPYTVLLFLGSGLLGLLVAGWLASKRQHTVSDELFTILLTGLLIGRQVFVMRYYEQYTSVWQMLDFRDRGIDWLAALVSMGLMLLWQCWRKPLKRRAILAGIVTMGLVWSAGTVWLNQQSKDYALETLSLMTLDQQSQSLAEVVKTPVTVVNLWATWCAGCQREMPVLEQAQQRYANVNIVPINHQESAAVVQSYLQQRGLHFEQVLLDANGQSAELFNVRGFPTTLVFDQHGQLLKRHDGELSAASLHALLQPFIKS